MGQWLSYLASIYTDIEFLSAGECCSDYVSIITCFDLLWSSSVRYSIKIERSAIPGTLTWWWPWEVETWIKWYTDTFGHRVVVYALMYLYYVITKRRGCGTEHTVSVTLVTGINRRCWMWQIWREPSVSYLLSYSISSYARRTPVYVNLNRYCLWSVFLLVCPIPGSKFRHNNWHSVKNIFCFTILYCWYMEFWAFHSSVLVQFRYRGQDTVSTMPVIRLCRKITIKSVCFFKFCFLS